MKILLTGATGFIGQELGKALVKQGFEIWAVSRSKEKAKLNLSYPAHIIEGDLTQAPIEKSKISMVDAVIHLMGESVGDGRWSKQRKEEILRSRVDSTKNLFQSLPKDLKIFISASGTGYYGDCGDRDLTESSPIGNDFLAQVCEQWESTIDQGLNQFPQTRKVILRTGMVLGSFGGALMKMLVPFRSGLGGVMGSGRQWMSWIHLQDVVALYLRAIQDLQMQGVFNAVAPAPVMNREFTKTLVQALGTRQGPPIPAFALKLLLGEMASLVLSSQKVHSERLAGFQFRFPDLASALEDCCRVYAEGDEIFYAEQYFESSPEKVFSFFGKAQNLEAITPPLLQFHIQSMSTEQIQPGTLIDYRLKIRGIPIGWQTQISEWQPNDHFRDLQLKGPYKKWDHFHSFEKLGAGTLMKDLVRFRLPMGVAGRLVSPLVRQDVDEIFSYRRKTVPGKI